MRLYVFSSPFLGWLRGAFPSEIDKIYLESSYAERKFTKEIIQFVVYSFIAAASAVDQVAVGVTPDMKERLCQMGSPSGWVSGML